jgi:hypothetical protein
MSTSTTPPSETYEEEWYLKDVEFNGRKLKIITQNLNGPCSFIAICTLRMCALAPLAKAYPYPGSLQAMSCFYEEI